MREGFQKSQEQSKTLTEIYNNTQLGPVSHILTQK